MKEIVSIEECLAQCNKNNIAVHGIHSANLQGNQDPKEIAETIMKDGLALRDNWKSILATAVSFSGLTVEELKNGIQDYRYGNGEQCNVIISVPNFITNSRG